jgi:hypothetical protein
MAAKCSQVTEQTDFFDRSASRYFNEKTVSQQTSRGTPRKCAPAGEGADPVHGCAFVDRQIFDYTSSRRIHYIRSNHSILAERTDKPHEQQRAAAGFHRPLDRSTNAVRAGAVRNSRNGR